MAAVGKKRKLYLVTRSGNTGLLMATGAAAVAYLLLKNNSQPVATTVPVDNGDSQGVLTVNTHPVIVDSGAGTGTNVIQPSPIIPTGNQAAISTEAAADKASLQWYAQDYPAIIAALPKMTSQELIDTYQYFGSYFTKGITLYRYPDPAHPGQWNTTLYDAVQVLRAKYGIF